MSFSKIAFTAELQLSLHIQYMWKHPSPPVISSDPGEFDTRKIVFLSVTQLLRKCVFAFLQLAYIYTINNQRTENTKIRKTQMFPVLLQHTGRPLLNHTELIGKGRQVLVFSYCFPYCMKPDIWLPRLVVLAFPPSPTTRPVSRALLPLPLWPVIKLTWRMLKNVSMTSGIRLDL